jgi:flagellar hook-length control protein FliK
MGIENLFTLQSGLTQIPNPAATSAAKIAAPSNLNFLDLILGKIQNINENKPNPSSITLESAPPPVAENSAENLLQIKNILSQHGFTIETDTPDASQTLTTPLIPDQKPEGSLLGLMQITLASDDQTLNTKINVLREKIQNMIQNGDQAIVTTNLTPEQITALLNAPEGKIPDELKDIGSIMIVLIKPEQDESLTQEAIDLSADPALANLLTLLVPLPQNKQTLSSSQPSLEKSENIIASKLNDLTPGIVEDPESSFEFEDFETILKNTENVSKTSKQNGQEFLQAVKNDAPKNTPNATNGFMTLQALPFTAQGGLVFNGTEDAGLYNDLGLNALSAQPYYTGTPGSLVTQSAGATLPHPATQAIAVNIQKAANGGQDRTISLELDPPELGRVEVRLTFAKDKSMKAHVIAEKPETYMMLQRDSDTLQRALENNGLESDGGLSFELAEKGFDFNQDNQRGGGHDTGGTGTSDTPEKTDIIHSTMTWHIDPESGHLRYDILV